LQRFFAKKVTAVQSPNKLFFRGIPSVVYQLHGHFYTTSRNDEKRLSPSTLSHYIFSIPILCFFNAITQFVETFVTQLLEDWDTLEEINVFSRFHQSALHHYSLEDCPFDGPKATFSGS
jgi:hypothetical protein